MKANGGNSAAGEEDDGPWLSDVKMTASEVDPGLTPAPAARTVYSLLREQAGALLNCAIHAESEEFLDRYASLTDARGRAAVVRNGYQPPRDLLTNLGPVTIRIPKLRLRIEHPTVFRSTLVRPYLRRTRAAISEAPALFQHALTRGDLHSAIAAVMGPESAALRPTVMQRLARRWETEHRRWLKWP
jgi:hypothetical protein